MQLERIVRQFLAQVRRRSTGGEGAADPDDACVPYESYDAFRAATGEGRDEYVLSLLRANDGCLKQTELVELTGASKATVSRWLADMEAEDRIERVRFGRENVVCLAGMAPDRP